jgi:hypothetical protein
MTHHELLRNAEQMIERLVSGATPETAAARLLHAVNLLRGEFELMAAMGDRGRVKTLLSLATKLTIRAGDMLGDTSQEHDWLKELNAEVNGMKASVAVAGT